MLWYGFTGNFVMSGGKFWFGLVVSFVLLALFFLTIDLSRLMEALLGANYWFVAPAVGLYLVSVLFRTLRWQRLLRHMRPIGVARLYPVVVVGYMANNLLPMRLGELVRSYYVGEREGISKTSALVTIFIERLLDALTLLLFVSAIALFVPLAGLAEGLSDRYGIPVPLLVAALTVPFVGAFAILLLAAFRPSDTVAMAQAIIRPLPDAMNARLSHIVDMFVDGLKPLSSPRTILLLFLMSVPVWLFEAGLFFLIGLGFDLHDAFDSPAEMALAMVMVVAIANIGSSIPAAPGGLGLFELIARETLVLLPLATVDRAVAGGYVAVVHLSLLLPMIVLGQVFLWAQQVSFASLSRAGQSVPQQDGQDITPAALPTQARAEPVKGDEGG